jgi:hypothetical protein
LAALISLAALALVQRRQIGLAAFSIPALLLPEAARVDFRKVHKNNTRRVAISAGAPRLHAVAIAAIAMTSMICVARYEGFLNEARGFPRAGIDCQWFPCEATDFLKSNPPPPNLFHDLYTGSYLAYQLRGNPGVFIDGRLEIYRGSTWRDYFGPPDGRISLDKLLDKYKIDTALLDIRGVQTTPGHMARILAARSDWPVVYFDDHYAIFVRETSETETYVRGRAFRNIFPFDENVLLKNLTDRTHSSGTLAEARRAVKNAPDSSVAHAMLATVYLNSGRAQEGNKELAIAQTLDPSLEVAPAQ